MSAIWVGYSSMNKILEDCSMKELYKTIISIACILTRKMFLFAGLCSYMGRGGTWRSDQRRCWGYKITKAMSAFWLMQLNSCQQYWLPAVPYKGTPMPKSFQLPVKSLTIFLTEVICFSVLSHCPKCFHQLLVWWTRGLLKPCTEHLPFAGLSVSGIVLLDHF